jgi:hypothetical protein
MLSAAAEARAAMLREETDMRVCWAGPELDNGMLLADQQRRHAEPCLDRCMNIGMVLDDGNGILGDQIEHKLTINF